MRPKEAGQMDPTGAVPWSGALNRPASTKLLAVKRR